MAWAKTTYYKKPETFESSASYCLNTISEWSIPLASWSANILCCLPIYQPLISVLFTMQHSGLPEFSDSLFTPKRRLSSISLIPSMQWIKLINKNWPLTSPFGFLSLDWEYPWILVSSSDMGIATVTYNGRASHARFWFCRGNSSVSAGTSAADRICLKAYIHSLINHLRFHI